MTQPTLASLTARPRYTVGSLFSGIGGFDHAFEAAGFHIGWQIENDPFCNLVLARHWPHVARYGDIRTVEGSALSYCDVLAGGFPCTNISIAGNREGIVSGNPSGLWLEFARVIGELRPRVVFVENVPNLLTRDGITILKDFARLGLDARWGTISAYDAGAGHIRKRLWIMAYPHSHGRRRENVLKPAYHPKWNCPAYQQAGYPKRHTLISGRPVLGKEHRKNTQPGVGLSIDGIPARLVPIARQGHLQFANEQPRQIAEKENPAWRKQLQALGNAVVPQVVYPLALAIKAWLEAQDSARAVTS